VSFGIQKESHGCGYGCSSSRFFASETPFSSLVALKAPDKRNMPSGTCFSNF